MYRRSVHCRYCYETGHNINGCPKLKEFAAKNPDSYWASRLQQKAEQAKNRKCSYCNTVGHNKKTCSSMLDDKIKIAAVSINFRQKFIQNIVERDGFVPGALVTINTASGYVNGEYKYDLQDQLALVTDINFDEVIAIKPNVIPVKVQFLHMTDYHGGKQAETWIYIPRWYIMDRKPEGNGYYNLNHKVVSRGFYNVENPEELARDKNVIESMQNDLGNHFSVEKALNYYNLEVNK